MIPAYIISLPSETRRRQHVQAECAKYGIPAEIVDAVDMRHIEEEKLRELCSLPLHKKPKKQRYLTKGELGCASSHHQIYQTMLARQQEFALILEDDATFIQDPTSVVQAAFLQRVKQQYDFDVLLLGYVKTVARYLPYYYRRIPIKKRVTMATPQQDFVFGTPWEQFGCGAVAYVITRKGAEKLLDITKKPCVPADDWLYFEQQCGLKVLHCRPTLVLEDLENLDSTIRTERPDFWKPKLSSLIIRSVKGWMKNFAMNVLGFK